ncbi:spike base protein, RCAP_Rcc01079 family [Bradyrhizobium sp. PMVTL-01]|uniref:spike base protein, RCAP_Rcc01079 family n=1 Tax=Bradyrhizobium sp. PMVTL-01 TaxID=3434999 RepID=UPI003F6F632E
MAKTAADPFSGTNGLPVTAGRNGAVVTPSDTNDLKNVTTSLIVTIGTGGTGISVLYAAETRDSAPVTIPLGVGTWQLNLQVRRIMATGTTLGTGGGVVAQW